MNKITAAITGIEGYVPDYILTNKELETYIRTCMNCWKRVVLALDQKHADSYLE